MIERVKIDSYIFGIILCGNETCKNYIRPSVEWDQDGKSTYCSNRCKRAQKQRRYRRRQRANGYRNDNAFSRARRKKMAEQEKSSELGTGVRTVKFNVYDLAYLGAHVRREREKYEAELEKEKSGTFRNLLLEVIPILTRLDEQITKAIAGE